MQISIAGEKGEKRRENDACAWSLVPASRAMGYTIALFRGAKCMHPCLKAQLKLPKTMSVAKEILHVNHLLY